MSENLHRAELTALQRDEQIARWIELAKLRQAAPVSGGRGHEGGTRAASREIGVDDLDARRAKKTASLSPEAKEVAREVARLALAGSVYPAFRSGPLRGQASISGPEVRMVSVSFFALISLSFYLFLEWNKP